MTNFFGSDTTSNSNNKKDKNNTNCCQEQRHRYYYNCINYTRPFIIVWKKNRISLTIWIIIISCLFLGSIKRMGTGEDNSRIQKINQYQRTKKTILNENIIFPISISTKQLRILYIVTSLAEYDTGGRHTTRGYDRYQYTLIPIVRESIESMLSYGYHVDFYLICHYNITYDRYMLLRNELPIQVGIQIWNDATPIGYKVEERHPDKVNKTQPITRALARQHRYVIKDKYEYYDMFVNFEDDMLIKGDSITHYINMTQELYKLRQVAPEHNDYETITDDERRNNKRNIKLNQFYGSMTKSQLERTLPGFIRVESLLNEKQHTTQEQLEPIPITNRPTINSKPCCYISNKTSNDKRPMKPTSESLFLWETLMFALGIRKLPIQSSRTMDWVLLQRGPFIIGEEYNITINDYWSNTKGYYNNLTLLDRNNNNFYKKRPHPQLFPYVNNQGGWMATKIQIFEWHTKICYGSLLPPYNKPSFDYDGLDGRNVEYWSGGIQLVTRRHGCKLQRFISLNETRFSYQLLYHTSNNKQRQLQNKKNKLIRINDFFGQLNTIKLDAENEMHQRVINWNNKLQQQQRQK